MNALFKNYLWGDNIFQNRLSFNRIKNISSNSVPTVTVPSSADFGEEVDVFITGTDTSGIVYVNFLGNALYNANDTYIQVNFSKPYENGAVIIISGIQNIYCSFGIVGVVHPVSPDDPFFKTGFQIEILSEILTQGNIFGFSYLVIENPEIKAPWISD